MLFSLIIVVAAVIVFDLAADRFGVDSRDGRDWLSRPAV